MARWKIGLIPEPDGTEPYEVVHLHASGRRGHVSLYDVCLMRGMCCPECDEPVPENIFMGLMLLHRARKEYCQGGRD